jgi:hypothetical protein
MDLPQGQRVEKKIVAYLAMSDDGEEPELEKKETILCLCCTRLRGYASRDQEDELLH